MVRPQFGSIHGIAGLVDLKTIHQPRYWQLSQKRVLRSECLAHSHELITDVGGHQFLRASNPNIAQQIKIEIGALMVLDRLRDPM